MNRANLRLLAVVLAVAAFTAAGVAWLISMNVGKSAARHAYVNEGVLEVVCDVQVSRPGEHLGLPFEVSKLTLPAIFNFDEHTGAYPGEYTISMNRKGTLQVNGDTLEIHRPAMFKRHGVTIIGEHVTLNRQTGEFRQWLDLNGGKRLDLVQGSCRRSDNAPF